MKVLLFNGSPHEIGCTYTALEEIAKKKAAIEKELKEEIAKRKTLEFYEKMAEEYKDNPRLAELVGELKELGA